MLAEAGLLVTEVSDYMGFPEIVGGRVKTLHPKMHGGILRRRNIDDAVMHGHDIAPIDMVMVSLYPLCCVGTVLEPTLQNVDISATDIPALDYVRQRGAPIVIKADGLAASKA